MRLVACLGLCLLLSGCSDVSDMFSFGGDDAAPEVMAAPAAPPAAARADDGFCRGVAAGDATGHGYDSQTQTRVAQQSYAQCRATFAR
jgi:hypothetical protein